MANITHTQAADGNPTGVPPSPGAHYVNTDTGQRWISKGSATPLDWGQPLPGSPVQVANGVTQLIVDVLQPSMVWKFTGMASRSIVFPYAEVYGLSIVELLIDNVVSVETTVTVANPGGENAQLMGRTEFVLSPDSRTYLRFAYYRDDTSIPVWRVLEEKTLNIEDVRVRYITPGSADPLAMVLTPETTIWKIDGPRTLILPQLPNEKLQFFGEINLVINTKFAGQCLITIDTANGAPLIGHPSLTIPADSAQLYKLACFMELGVYYWSVVSVTNLTG